MLPIPPAADGARLCVLGPLAHQDPEDWLGAYSSHANRHLERVTTPLTGIRKHWPRGDLRARLRLRRRRRRPAGRCAGAARGGRGAALAAGDARGALPRRAARVERRIGRRWPSRGCRISSAGSCSSCAGPTAGEADRLRHRRPGAAHSARGRGERRRHLLDGAPRHLRGRRHRRHPRRRLQPDRAALARAADRRRDHLGLRHAAGADRPAGRAGGGGLRRPGASATTGAPTTSASAPAGRRPTTSARATPTPPSRSPTGRSTTARSPPRPARRSPPASG